MQAVKMWLGELVKMWLWAQEVRGSPGCGAEDHSGHSKALAYSKLLSALKMKKLPRLREGNDLLTVSWYLTGTRTWLSRRELQYFSVHLP